jgi:hypothetical protein
MAWLHDIFPFAAHDDHLMVPPQERDTPSLIAPIVLGALAVAISYYGGRTLDRVRDHFSPPQEGLDG